MPYFAEFLCYLDNAILRVRSERVTAPLRQKLLCLT